MRFLCFGAGAVGTYIGGSLALAGHEVVFIERPAASEELERNGLKLDLNRGRVLRGFHRILPDKLQNHADLSSALRAGPFDAAIYALKSFDTPAAADSMRAFAAQMPSILCFSNGVANEGVLAGVVGASKVVACTLTSAIGRPAVGEIVLEKLRGIGISSGARGAHALFGVTKAAGLEPQLFDDPAAMKWSKMLGNLLANATSAILDMSPAAIYADVRLYSLEMQMLRECLAVMRAQNISVVDLPGTPVRALAWATHLPLAVSRPFVARAAGAGRGDKMPSFHIDLVAGRGQSEVNYLNGAVVQAGAKSGIPTPVNSALTATLLDLTAGRLDRAQFARRPEQLLKAIGG